MIETYALLHDILLLNMLFMLVLMTSVMLFVGFSSLLQHAIVELFAYVQIKVTFPEN